MEARALYTPCSPGASQVRPWRHTDRDRFPMSVSLVQVILFCFVQSAILDLLLKNSKKRARPPFLSIDWRLKVNEANSISCYWMELRRSYGCPLSRSNYKAVTFASSSRRKPIRLIVASGGGCSVRRVTIPRGRSAW